MDFKYDEQINKRAWESTLKYKEMFGKKFPDKISITEEDKKIAQEKILEYYTLWNRDEDLKKTIFKIYEYNLPEILKCYIVTTKTSAIYLEKKCILLSVKASSYNFSNPIPSTIIHEFSHIAFLDKWMDFCKKLGYTNNGIQELKEVLTVINNSEFKNIEDRGYQVHQEIREIIEKMWLGGYDLKKIISDFKIISLVNSLNTIIKKCKRGA